ncbi:MAG: domain S-box [Gammaproteobacteria bacterium]|nr:domain S-box [Gammaproteobacteria bacterium]
MLQSLSEELATVNGQLQAKVLELEALTNDLVNLLGSTDVAVVLLDPLLHVRRFTPAIGDLLEVIPADVGRPVAHLAQKFSDGSLIADAGEVLEKLVPLESETHSHSDRWYLRRTLPYRTPDNRVAGVVVTFIDITARKKAEVAVTAGQAQLQAAIEDLPAAVLMAESLSRKLLFGNRRAATLLNQPFPLPCVGRDWTEVCHEFREFRADQHNCQPERWPLARTLATGEAVLDEEHEFIRPDGGAGTLAMSASPIRNSAGEIVAAVGAFWDVTARKGAEAALRESERRFRMLAESAHDYAIFMLDPQGRVRSWNRGAERVTGYSEGDVLGQSAAIFFTADDRAAGIPQTVMREAAHSGHALDERWHERCDGTRFWASGELTLMRDSNGTAQGFVKIMRDLTERKNMEAQLQDALQYSQMLRARAESANRAKDDFISTVSHELRTPLNTIRLWSRILIGGRVQGNEAIEGGKVIDRAALAQQRLVDDLLDVSRMTSGVLRLALRNARLSEVIEAAVSSIRPLAQDRQIELTTDLSANVGVVRIDPDRIQQVMWNLLANAVKFTPEGGRVDVILRRLDGTVKIEVRDTGIGIAPEFLPHVFDRFRQADPGAGRRYAGLGLGLAIAKQLVELHGGAISARSEGKERGTTFTIELLLERRQVGPAQESGMSEQFDSSDLHGLQILLVEDEIAAREATGLLLEQSGARVRAVSSASKAREAYKEIRPHIIVADLGLPEEDGYALMMSLRKLELIAGSPSVPALAVTAFARREDRGRALAAGFDEYLAKPVDADRLIELIGRLGRGLIPRHRSEEVPKDS